MALRAGRVGVAPDQVNQQGKVKGADIAIATPDKAGTVKPVAKTSGMTQAVGIDSAGKLYTEPAVTLHEYSTTEKIVGKWIDNKSIYEITVPLTTNLSADLSDLKIETIIKLDCPGETSPIKYSLNAVSGTNSRAMYYSTSDNKIHVDGSATVAYAIIQYTKATT